MIKNSLKFLLIGFLLFSCSDKENPEDISGRYLPQSIMSDLPLDITNDGISSVNLLEQLETTSRFGGISTGTVFLNLDPSELRRPLNIKFSQVYFRVPYHGVGNDAVFLEYGQFGRRFDLDENGTVSIDWSTLNQDFEIPEQIHETIVIADLILNSGRNPTVELVLNQKLYDHSKDEWIEAKIFYSFIKSMQD